MLEKIKGWKSIAFSVIMGAIGLWLAFKPGAVLPDGATVQATLDQAEAAFAGLWAVGGIILRLITNTKVGSST